MSEEATGHDAPDAAEPVAVAVLVAEGPVRDRVVEALADADAGDFAVSTVTRTAEVVELVRDGAVDCVVADAQPPGADAAELLDALRGADPDVPVVLLAGSGEATRRAIDAGATDVFLVSSHDRADAAAGRLPLLPARLRDAVAHRRTRERESLLSDVTANISECVFVTDADYDLVYISEVAEAVFGVPTSAVLSDRRSVLDRVDPDHRDRVERWYDVLEADAAASDVDGPYEIEYRYDHPEAGWRWINATMHPILDADGAIVRVVGVASDVTERREAIEELRRNEATFRGIAETSTDVIFRVDTSGTVTYVSPAVRDVLGVDPDEIEGGPFADYIAGDHLAAANETFEEILAGEGGNRHTYALEHADGRAVQVEVSSVPIRRDGAVVGVQGVARDVSERRARERELEQYETIVETVPDGVFVLDEDGRVVGANERAARMVGLEDRADDLPSEPIPELDAGWIGSDRAIERYTDAVAELRDGDRERTMFRLEATIDGERRAFELHLALRPRGEDGFRGAVGVIREITDRRRYERELERQNERLQGFAGAVSHDLRNPLTVAQAQVAHAAETGDTDVLGSAGRALDRMEALVDDVLSLARQGRPLEDPTSVPVGRVARRAWSTVHTADADLVVADDLGEVRAEESRLRRLFENLFRNCVEHAGTAVTVTVGPLPNDDGFYVEDDGPGIPPEDRERAFESGFTTAEDGTGFGLAIVAEVAEAHGWTVSIAEGAAGGARFEVRTGNAPAEADG